MRLLVGPVFLKVTKSLETLFRPFENISVHSRDPSLALYSVPSSRNLVDHRGVGTTPRSSPGRQ